MSLIDQRLAEDLKELKDAISSLGESVRTALSNSLKSLNTNDHALAYETILNDRPINRAAMDINRLSNAFVAKHLPSAGHLRFVSSVMRLSIELERVGDYASSISRSVTVLRSPMDEEVKSQLQEIGSGAVEVFHQAVQAFATDDGELAVMTRKKAKKVNKAFEPTLAKILEKGESRDIQTADLVETVVILRRLERVCDQTMNICEETVFATSGEELPSKKFNVLFLDDSSDGRLELALAEALHNYPDTGSFKYLSKGKYTGDSLAALMQKAGLDKKDVYSESKEWNPEGKSRTHIIVALTDTASEMIDEMPFHAVMLDWDLPGTSGKEGTEAAELRSVYSDISDRMQNLMNIVHGE